MVHLFGADIYFINNTLVFIHDSDTFLSNSLNTLIKFKYRLEKYLNA